MTAKDFFAGVLILIFSHIVEIALALLVGVICGFIALALAGRNKGCGVFALGFFLGPLGLILAAIIGNRPEPQRQQPSYSRPDSRPLLRTQSRGLRIVKK